jgi:hypothetical protein
MSDQRGSLRQQSPVRRRDLVIELHKGHQFAGAVVLL